MLEALAKTEHHSEAMDIIKKYWGGMLSLGATTFWEDFNLEWIEINSKQKHVIRMVRNQHNF